MGSKVYVPKWVWIRLAKGKGELNEDELIEFLELTAHDSDNLDADYVRAVAAELMKRYPGRRRSLWAVASAPLSDNVLRQEAFDAFKAAGYTLSTKEYTEGFRTWSEAANDLLKEFAQFERRE